MVGSFQKSILDPKSEFEFQTIPMISMDSLSEFHFKWITCYSQIATLVTPRWAQFESLDIESTRIKRQYPQNFWVKSVLIHDWNSVHWIDQSQIAFKKWTNFDLFSY